MTAYLPQVFWGESSVQVRVHISRALLHSLGIGDKRNGLDSLPLYFGAVLHPQVYKRHAWHLVSVRASENRHSPRLAEARRVVVRRHAWVAEATQSVDEDTPVSVASGTEEKFSGFAASVFKCPLTLHTYVTCPLACCGQSPCVNGAELNTDNSGCRRNSR